MTLKPALTPPMGWNSWDCYGTTVTEEEVLANARFMAEHLAPFGWDIIVIDADWSDPGARSHGYNEEAALHIDEFGRLVPDPVRFPSAADGAGFGPLAAEIHALGLRFGIHIMRGIPRRAVAANSPILGSDARAADVADPGNRCEWNPHYLGLDHSRPGAQAYYDSLAALYAQWGVDFVKADDLLWPYQRADIESFSGALRRSLHDFQLSLSPGRDMSLARLDGLRETATMWRGRRRAGGPPPGGAPHRPPLRRGGAPGGAEGGRRMRATRGGPTATCCRWGGSASARSGGSRARTGSRPRSGSR